MCAEGRSGQTPRLYTHFTHFIQQQQGEGINDYRIRNLPADEAAPLVADPHHGHRGLPGRRHSAVGAGQSQGGDLSTAIAFVGIYWLIAGIVEIVGMFNDHKAWGWKLFIGIVSIIAGVYVLMYPVAAAVALPRVTVLILGLWGLMQGTVLLIMAFKGGGWGAGILGVVAIFFGLILIGEYGSLGSGLAMLWVAAFWGVIGGILLMIQAFRQRKAA